MKAKKGNRTTKTLDVRNSNSRRRTISLQQFRPKAKRRKTRTSRLTQSDIERLKAELLAKRDEVFATLSGIECDMTEVKSNDIGPRDLADMASASYAIEQDGGLVKSEARVLGEIDEALERIHEGTYGTCAQCKKRIPKRRLLAIPWARYCVPCANGSQSSQQPTIEKEKEKWAEKHARRLQCLFGQWLKAHRVNPQEFYNFEMKELLDYYDDPLRRSFIESL